MKKFVFLAYHKDYDRFLAELRELGLIHVAETDRTAEESDELLEHVSQLKSLLNAKKTLQQHINKKDEIAHHEVDIDSGKSLPQQIDAVQSEQAALVQQLQVSAKEREMLLPWGNFNPDTVALLEKEGYRFDFFVVPENQYNPQWETDYDAVVVNRLASKVFFVTVTQRGNVAEELELEPLKLPKIELQQLDQLMDSLNRKIEEQDQKLKELVAHLPSLEAAIADLEQKVTFTKVKQSSQAFADDKLMLLQGWAPAESQSEISEYLDSRAAYYEVSDPKTADNVPVKLKNNRFSRLFEPITKMFALPAYTELDPTPFFAPFFMLFFGLCMGDAGYGMLIFGAATYFKVKSKNDDLKPLLELFQWFGGATFVIATITGTFFGMPLFGVPLLQTFYTRLLGAGEGADSATLAQLMQDKLMVFAIAVGVLQIIFGMVLSAVNIIKNDGFID